MFMKKLKHIIQIPIPYVFVPLLYHFHMYLYHAITEKTKFFREKFTGGKRKNREETGKEGEEGKQE